jgi:hypothetical protein
MTYEDFLGPRQETRSDYPRAEGGAFLFGFPAT